MTGVPTLALLMAATGIFLSAEHPVSKRTVILEEERGVAYLYLTVPGGMRPEADVVVYTTGDLASDAAALKAAQDGVPPPLTAQLASSEAVLRNVLPEHFSFRWSPDGKSVALLRKGRPVALLVPGPNKKYVGYSRALARSGFFGKPWDDAVFTSWIK